MWAMSWLSQQAAGLKAGLCTTHHHHQHSRWEGSFEGIPGITPRQVNPKNNPRPFHLFLLTTSVLWKGAGLWTGNHQGLLLSSSSHLHNWGAFQAIEHLTSIGATHYFFPKYAKLVNDHLQLCTHLDKESFSEKGGGKPGWVQTNPNV